MCLQLVLRAVMNLNKVCGGGSSALISASKTLQQAVELTAKFPAYSNDRCAAAQLPATCLPPTAAFACRQCVCFKRRC